MKIYLSLPITGRTEAEARAEAQRNIQYIKEVCEAHEVYNPLDNGLPFDAPIYEHMRRDYKALLDCDAIFLCDGWEYSHGCMDELAVAADCRMYVCRWGGWLLDADEWYADRTGHEMYSKTDRKKQADGTRQ